ncbi:MAG: recombinase family protein [Candidatus Pelethousia sp.]|nr:recombinase family protein [Candidatus Pelethousia sp.]
MRNTQSILNIQAAENQNRVCGLYRVSSPGQVDKVQDDIPMQRAACREFVEQKGWTLVDELAEKGISGYKVSARDRDAIQMLQQRALRHEFDILLVFMFDRLGRIESETPFIVEWFVRQGIQVWSVKEGEQRFESHVDKLTNYIRFWQAAGESEKTSIRIRTRLGQLAEEGQYHGGTTPYGFERVHLGRLNKQGLPVKDLQRVPEEAATVQLIFEKYVYEGMGTHTIGNFLYSIGIVCKNGKVFTNTTIRHMLGRVIYTGRIKCGEVITKPFPHLRIIDDDLFEKAQELLLARSTAYSQNRTVPRQTLGPTLLSGNIFCTHCGGRLVATTNAKKHVHIDGTVNISRIHRYICYNKVRHHALCAGQSGYTASRIDEVIDQLIRKVLYRCKDMPAEPLVKMRCAAKITESEALQKKAKADMEAATSEMKELQEEVFRVIRGESTLPQSVLAEMLKVSEKKVTEASKQYMDACESVRDVDRLCNDMSKQIGQLQSWSTLYNNAEKPIKKMIASSLISRVTVSRDYSLNVQFNISYEQFLGEPEKNTITNLA